MGKGKYGDKGQWLGAAPLKNLPAQPTVLLLRELRRMNVLNSQDLTGNGLNDDGILPTYDRAEYTAQLKAILATREHVNNKIEAKAQRQSAAQAHRHVERRPRGRG